MTLLDCRYNDVGHVVNNLCHPRWIRKVHNMYIGQVNSRVTMDGDIMCCNRSPGTHELPVQVLNL